MADYHCFKEVNNWEGETWRFYIILSDGQHRALSALLEGEYPEACYSLSEKTYTEEEVDFLVAQEDDCTYMAAHNKCGALNKLPAKIDWEDDDPFYKGQIRDYCKDVKKLLRSECE
jgi:hypothetical protein